MSLPTPYYDDGKGIVIYHGDCREILPHLPKVDLVLKNSLKNSTEDATNITNETLRQRKELGATESRNRMALSGSKLVSGPDSLILSSVANRHDEGTQEARDSIARQGQGGSTERSLQGRNREHLLSASYPERQMLTMPLNDEACDSSQERGSSGQPSGKSASALRELPQSASQETVVGRSQILLLTDPPYGINYNPSGGGKVPKRFTNADKVIGDDVPFNAAWLIGFADVSIIWGASNFAHTLPPSRGWLVWDKKDGVNLTNQFSDCEIAWTSRNSPIRIFRHRWTGYMKDSEQDVARDHPTQKPIALMTWCLGFAPDAQTILDPFMGSGTTLRAAKDLGRQCIGIEIEEKYCEIAARRLAQEVLQL